MSLPLINDSLSFLIDDIECLSDFGFVELLLLNFLKSIVRGRQHLYSNYIKIKYIKVI